MPVTVAHILGVCPVSQIDRPIVDAVTVEMTHLKSAWAWPDECLSDQLVH
jgi:hypothetical protein